MFQSRLVELPGCRPVVGEGLGYPGVKLTTERGKGKRVKGACSGRFTKTDCEVYLRKCGSRDRPMDGCGKLNNLPLKYSRLKWPDPMNVTLYSQGDFAGVTELRRLCRCN